MEPATDIQLLSDPCNDRVMKSMAPPPHKALTVDSLYKGGKIIFSNSDYECLIYIYMYIYSLMYQVLLHI